jgi:MoxR-like ATPase
MTTTAVAQSIDQFRERFSRITQEVARRIVGHEDVVNGTVTSLLAGGHVLLEGIPGVGKTSLVHTLADVLHLKFSRIQFTPDLMPADIVGTNIVQEHSHGGAFFEFQPGPIFANVVLADEINRATPKTQSALLEAMQDVSVSVGKTTYQLEQPFLVLATQNRSRHAKSARDGRHLSAAGSAARSVLLQAAGELPVGRGDARHHRADDEGQRSRGDAGRRWS